MRINEKRTMLWVTPFLDGRQKAALLLFGLISIFTATIICPRLTPQREPSYHGKLLTAWLREYDRASYQASVNQAIHEMGEEAIPTLIDMLKVEDNIFRRLLMNLLSRQSFIQMDLLPAETLHKRALIAFRALDSQTAKKALPSLIQINSKFNFSYVMSIMADFGSDALPALTHELTNAVPEIRRFAAYELQWVDSNYTLLVSTLADRLQDDDPEMRRIVAMALGTIAKDSESAVPALIDGLVEEHYPAAKTAMAFALGRYGRNSIKAIPFLNHALSDPDPAVRSESAASIRAIKSAVDKKQ